MQIPDNVVDDVRNACGARPDKYKPWNACCPKAASAERS